jgi:uncharacterized membrane protein YphA (DoxX/SURF4 family)
MGPFRDQVVAWHLPKWVAYVSAWSALAGGALIGVGFLTRFFALVAGLFACGILIKAKWHSGYLGGLDMPILALGICISLLLSGAGKLSVDHKLFGRRMSAPTV